MSDKSHVGMGHKVCPVCGIKHDEVILLDKRLKETLSRDMHMGYALCPEHAEENKTYLFLIEIENDMFTGRNARIKWEVAKQIFIKEIADNPHGFAFCGPDMLPKLEAMTRRTE